MICNCFVEQFSPIPPDEAECYLAGELTNLKSWSKSDSAFNFPSPGLGRHCNNSWQRWYHPEDELHLLCQGLLWVPLWLGAISSFTFIHLLIFILDSVFQISSILRTESVFCSSWKHLLRSLGSWSFLFAKYLTVLVPQSCSLTHTHRMGSVLLLEVEEFGEDSRKTISPALHVFPYFQSQTALINSVSLAMWGIPSGGGGLIPPKTKTSPFSHLHFDSVHTPLCWWWPRLPHLCALFAAHQAL